jgi:choline-sulfatase
MKPANLVFIMSDEHNKRVLGCDRRPMSQTPNLDRLAARGTRGMWGKSTMCGESAAEFTAFLKAERVRIANVGKRAGITPE